MQPPRRSEFESWLPRAARVVLYSLLLCDALVFSQTPIRQSSEAEVKAAFLVSFAKFVEWPGRPPGQDFVICIAGNDPFGSILERTVEGEVIANSRIALKRVPRWQSPCQVLFVGASGLDNSRFLAGVPAGVLTVGEETSFLRDGGMIALVVEDRRVRFDVNYRAAVRGSVRISSKLLDVAREVEK